MPIDSGDIERLKAAIPKDFQPPPTIRGRLTSYFLSVDSLRESTPLQGSETDPVNDVDRRAAADARERYNLGMGFVTGNTGLAAPGFILSGAQVAIQNAQVAEVEQRKHDDERFALDQMNAAVDARISKLNADLIAIDKRLEEIRVRRAAIGTSFEALDEIARRRARGEKLDPANEADRHLMETAGMSEEEANSADYAATIAARRRDLDREDSALSTEWDTKMRRRGDVLHDLADAQTAKGELENADTGEARVLAERRAATMLGRQQLSTAAYQSTSDPAKVIAADAVAVSAESEAFNRDAVAVNRAAVVQNGTNNFSPS
jgi:hypothetical protein